MPAELHRTHRAAWLRAAVLGADDGIVSIASLLIGIAASSASLHAVLVGGIAGLVAGALSMAAGEYVSVSSQRDTERADIARETAELDADPDFELRELVNIYVGRGLEPGLATRVAEGLTRSEPLAAHLRDELGLTEAGMARPMQASVASALSFGIGAVIPLLVMVAAPASVRIALVAATGLVLLATLGAVGGRIGGAPTSRGAVRVVLGGGLAMAATALIGRLVGGVGL